MARKQNQPDACKARGFKKGTSGNPAGRPPINREVEALAKTHTVEAIEQLVGIGRDASINGSARVNAWNSILDRGWGRAKQSVDVKVDHDATGWTQAINALREEARLEAIGQQQAVNIIEGEIIPAETREMARPSNL